MQYTILYFAYLKQNYSTILYRIKKYISFLSYNPKCTPCNEILPSNKDETTGTDVNSDKY